MIYLTFFIAGFIGRYLMENNYDWNTFIEAIGVGLFLVISAFILSSVF